MLDIPSIGLEKLNSAMHSLAESSDDPDEFDSAMAIFETARKLVGRTKLRKALTETSTGSADQIRRERDVMRALTEAEEVKRIA